MSFNLDTNGTSPTIGINDAYISINSLDYNTFSDDFKLRIQAPKFDYPFYAKSIGNYRDPEPIPKHQNDNYKSTFGRLTGHFQQISLKGSALTAAATSNNMLNESN